MLISDKRRTKIYRKKIKAKQAVGLGVYVKMSRYLVEISTGLEPFRKKSQDNRTVSSFKSSVSPPDDRQVLYHFMQETNFSSTTLVAFNLMK